MSRAKATSRDLEGYIKHYPAHEWLLRYWYEHGHEMEVDYEAERAQDSVTAQSLYLQSYSEQWQGMICQQKSDKRLLEDLLCQFTADADRFT